MAEFDSEEMTRLKQWWNGNGMAIVMGAVVGLAVIIGWQGWNWYQDRQTTEAAGIYQQFQQGVVSGNVNDAVLNTAERLKNNFAGTPYAANAALRLAGHFVAQEDYAEAREQLAWAMNNAANDGIRHIARVRAARLAWSQDDADKALKMLDAEHPSAFNALYAEVRGDILADQGDRDGAYKAYQQALESLPRDTPSRALESKRADNAPADAADAPTEQKSAVAS
jgi:predicted negative regulator of RcsB-dependent stress response